MITMPRKCRKRVKLVEKPKYHYGANPDYEILLDGDYYGDVFFNMTGYVGGISVPGSEGNIASLDIGERGISAYKKEIARANREFCEDD